MGNFGSMNIRGLKEIQKELNKLQAPNKFVEDCTKALAKELWKRLKFHTPVKSGSLRRGWNIGEIRKDGDKYVVEIINPIEYATYVEYGHRQEPGRYVPAIGKTLKHAWVRGKFMMKISEQEMETITPQILENKISQYLGGIMK